MSNVIRVTRVKRHSRRSLTEGKQTVLSMKKTDMSAIYRNTSPTDLYNNNKKTPSIQEAKNDVDRSLFSHSVIKKDSVESIDQVATPSVSSITGPRRDTTHTSLTTFNSLSCKVAPSNDYDPIRSAININSRSLSTKKPTLDGFQSLRLSIGDRRDLYTIEKENIRKKRRRKLCLSCSPFRCFALVLHLSLFLVALAVIPAVLITLNRITTTTITQASITTLTNNTSTTSISTTLINTSILNSTSSTLSTTSIILTSSSSTTTYPTTIVTTTSTASTISITSNTCTSTFTNVEMVAHCIPCGTYTIYNEFSYNYTAISNVTRIAFAFRRQTRYFALDNVSVRDFATPSIELLNNGNFETGDLSFWVYCDQYNASSTGGVKSNFSYSGFTYFAQSGIYYYVGGSTTSADYILQSFPTEVGHKYSVTMWAMHPGSEASTSVGFFLGI